MGGKEGRERRGRGREEDMDCGRGDGEKGRGWSIREGRGDIWRTINRCE